MTTSTEVEKKCEGYRTGENICKKMTKERCLDVFILGDLIYPVGLKSFDDPQFGEKFGRFLPWQPFVVLGNHERYSSNQTKIWTQLAKKYNFYFCKVFYYSI